MDRYIDGERPRYKFSVGDSDWVEWLVVALLSVVAGVGVLVLTGAVATSFVVALLVLGVSATVIALV